MSEIEVADVVVLDSNALYDDPWFTNARSRLFLTQVANFVRAVVIPEVVVLETIENVGKQVDAIHSTLNREHRKLARLTGGTPILSDWDLYESIRSGYDRFLRRDIDKQGWQLAPTPAVLHDVLVNKAISRTKPFNESGTGYRDALIWHTLLEIMFGHDDETVVLISNDQKAFGTPDDGVHPDLAHEFLEFCPSSKLVLLDSIKTFSERFIEPRLSNQASFLTLGEAIASTGLVDDSFHKDLQNYLNRIVGTPDHTYETEFSLFPDDTTMFFAEQVTNIHSIQVTKKTDIGDKRALLRCVLEITVEFSALIYARYLNKVYRSFLIKRTELTDSDDGRVAMVFVDTDMIFDAVISVGLDSNKVIVEAVDLLEGEMR